MKKTFTIICALLAVFMRFCAAAEDQPNETVPTHSEEWVTTVTTEPYASQETQVQTTVPDEVPSTSVPNENGETESQETQPTETEISEPEQDENMGDWA